MSFTIKHRDEFERSGRWSLARRSLDLASFGMNIVEIEPGKDIPEHDEKERDHEEVFIVLEGDAMAVIDGAEHPAPEGTFVRVDPEHTRTIVNTGDRPVRLLLISAPTTSGYTPLNWA